MLYGNSPQAAVKPLLTSDRKAARRGWPGSLKTGPSPPAQGSDNPQELLDTRSSFPPSCARVCAQLLSHAQLFETPRGQVPLSMGFSWREYWVTISSSRGLNLSLLHWQVDSLPLSHLGSPPSKS